MTARAERAGRIAPVWAGVLGSVTATALGSLAPAALAAVLATAVSAVSPALIATVLMFAVVLQDWLVVVASPAAQRADEALLVIGLAGLAVRIAATGRLSRTPLDAAIVCFTLLALISGVVHGSTAAVTVLGTLALLKGPLAYAFFARVPTSRAGVARVVPGLLALVAGLAAVGVAQWLGGPEAFRITGRWEYYLDWQGGKAPSLFMNHNALGHACVLGGLLATGLALSSDRGRRRHLYAAAGIACLLGLVVSASRESWLAAAAALLVGGWITRSRRLLTLAVLVTVVLAIGAVVVYFSTPLLREEIARRSAGVSEGWHLYRLGFSDWAYRGEYRVYVILKSWEVFLDHWFLGTGPGRFGGQVAMVYGSPLYEQYGFLPLRGEFHPLDVFWSRLLAEFGIAGTAAYLWAWLLAGRIFWSGSRSRDPLVRGLGSGGMMAWVAVIVLAVFAPALEDAMVAIPIWAWSGVVWALASRPPAPDP